MPIRVIPYAPEHVPAVAAFNRRLAAAGSDWGFYESAEVDWLQPGLTPTVERRFYVAADGDQVHGAYCLKPQQFLLGGEPVRLANWQGPVSEGIINPRFALLAMAMFKDMAAREPLLFAWGATPRMLDLLRRMKWREYQTPFVLRVERPYRFLRLNAFLRSDAKGRAALDAAALSGMGWLGNAVLKAAQRVRHRQAFKRARFTVESRFGAWCDAIWQAAAPSYALVAMRDSVSMNALVPAKGWPEADILRVHRDGRDVGFAVVRHTRMKGDARFGDLYVGSLVDSLALPGEASAVVEAAARYLREQGVDLTVGNFSAADWIGAVQANGFVAVPNRRSIFVNDPLGAKLSEREVDFARIHLTLLDGDGPRAL